MTDPLEAALVLSGKPSVATGLRACRLPVWLHDCISGKKVVVPVSIELGQGWALEAQLVKFLPSDARLVLGGTSLDEV